MYILKIKKQIKEKKRRIDLMGINLGGIQPMLPNYGNIFYRRRNYL